MLRDEFYQHIFLYGQFQAFDIRRHRPMTARRSEHSVRRKAELLKNSTEDDFTCSVASCAVMCIRGMAKFYFPGDPCGGSGVLLSWTVWYFRYSS